VPILLDDAVAPAGYVTGANRETHLRGVEPGPRLPVRARDVRTVEPATRSAARPSASSPRSRSATSSSSARATPSRSARPTSTSPAGRSRSGWAPTGIGPARIAAAAVEQFADEAGISWPRALAPFDAELVGLGKDGTEERELAERVYGELRDAGLDVLYDDRDAGPGEKFADAELLGAPLRLTIGRRTAAAGEVEAQVRRGREDRSLPLDGVARAAAELWADLP
jgi:prolyl-tRNA synthetase